MFNRIKSNLIKYLREEKGQALIAVLAFLLLGSLTLPPILSLIGTSLKTDQVYKDKTQEFYTADSGVEDAIWQIKYDRLEVLADDPNYAYDFSTNCSYEVDDPLNGLTAEVTIQNVWIPSNVTPPADPAEAKEIIESNKLMVAGTADDDSNYKIKINFYPAEGEEDKLLVKSLGIWLPYGFSYVDESSNLEQADYGEAYYSDPTVSPHAGGQSVVWEFSSANLTYFPGVELLDYPQATEVTFEYTANETGARPATISWIETEGDVIDILPTTWDIDTRIYQITSVANDTEIEAYVSRCELRKMEAAIAGDYVAVGNSLMLDNHPDWGDKRDTLIDESDAEVNSIPTDADVIAAFLYWSGWWEDEDTLIWGQDNCDDFDQWDNPGDDWTIDSHYYNKHFCGHHVGGAPDDDRYLTMLNSPNLSTYASGTVLICWEQWESGDLDSYDALKFQLSGDGGSSWSDMITTFKDDLGDHWQDFSYCIPDEYLTDDFEFRFYLEGFDESGDECWVDNFAICEVIADTSVIFKINGDQVYLDGEGEPQIGPEEITASRFTILGNQHREFSYACYRDVSTLVKEYSNLGDDDNHTGNGIYTVGGVDADPGEHWSYAGWSIIIIYSSPKTAGHQLYLFDKFAWAREEENLDFDGDGEPGGTISGFVVPEPPEDLEEYPDAAKLTCFIAEGDNWLPGDKVIFNYFDETPLSDGYNPNNVWNGRSIGMQYDGVDIDTFHVTWESGMLHADDTEAHIDLPTQTDNWNLIYMILSVRSETFTGGTVHYVIRGS